MTRRHALPTAAAVMCLSLPAIAAAQTIGAAATAGMKRFSGEPGTSVLDTTSGGLMVTAGAPVTPRTSVEFEIGIERPSTVTKATDVQQRRLETAYTSEMQTFSVLGAVHPLVRPRIRAGIVGGLTFIYFRRTVMLHPPPSVSGSPPESVFVDRVGAATVGGEVDVFVSTHLAVVPAIRAHAFRLSSDLGGFSIRPSVGVKWAF